MDISKDKLFALGKEEGRQQLMNHIERQYENGKPVEINGKLYWLKDAKQNLCDVMDDLEAEWEAECGSKKFIVPITCSYTNGEIKRDVIIETDRAETAVLIAIRDFLKPLIAFLFVFANFSTNFCTSKGISSFRLRSAGTSSAMTFNR